ncbi:aminoglycoside phosphotransferase family protein [Streptomyces sp. JV185]|uniref:aminoglycoside phosphotransferase family protein n=1 Tax=Streptomyces sp. JV185 TaxID=858638 RepID=UPI002E75D594|nr:aminoglycoside phosphotransferase family protein [Streptomyces sp. JV185]MEE1767546.1 aminoglycoside phosphotransferase family protein [Streptomyces sp. JV185]
MKRLLVDVDSVTTRLVRRFGPQVAQWCADTPNLIARLTSRWDLSLGESLPDGASSITLRCQWPDGTPAVLKLSPDRALLTEQAGMLEWFADSGRVPAVLAVDGDAGAMVLEAVVPGTPAEDMPAASLSGQWPALLAALHGVAPPPRPARVLRGRCEEAFARVGRRLSEPAISARIDVTAWNRAIQRCERLLDTQATTVLLHGDLHLGNVLDGGAERGLTAIDPKACVGDPCFDAVDYVLAAAGQEGVETRCARVVAACGLDDDRLHAWSQVIAPFAAVAHLGNGGEEPVIDELLALTR